MGIRSAKDNYGTVTETGEGTNVFVAEVTFGSPKNGRKFQLTLREDKSFLIENLKSGETAEYTHKWLSADGKEHKSHTNKSQVTIRDGIVFANKLVKTYFRPEVAEKAPKVKKEKVAKVAKAPKVKKEKVIKAKKLKVIEGEEITPEVASEVINDGEVNAFLVNGKKFFYEEKEVCNLKGIEVTRAKNNEKAFMALGNKSLIDVRTELALKIAHEWVPAARADKIAAKK